MKTLLVLLLLLIPTLCFASTPYHATNGIWEEQLDSDFAMIEVGNGDTLYAVANGPPRQLKRSLDDGATWTTVKTFTRDNDGFKSLFVDSKGRVYVGLSGTGKVHRGLVSGDTLAFTDVLTMQCATGTGSWWYMAEADAGSLFVGNYAGTTDEHCAAIYRSSHGAHWSEVYYTEHVNRHIHVVGVDPWSDEVYASIGDLPVTDARIVHSANYGATWDTVRVGDVRCKPVSMAFTPTRRIWGSDVGTVSDTTNMIEWTPDDSAYTAELRLTGDEDNYVWAMASTDQRTLFAGTKGKQATGNDIRMYASWDSGGSWYTVKEFGCDGEWGGVQWISRKADSDGFSYYCVTQDDNSGSNSYRFTGAAVWTIGSGGDFATIAAALADFQVGPGDTLELLAGTHESTADALLEGMTLRGSTQDASLYIIKNGSPSESAITVNVPGVTVQDITFRDLGGYFTTVNKAMLVADDGADITVTRCAFMSLRGNTAPGFFAAGDGAGATTINLTFNDCRAETCKATGGIEYSAGAFNIKGCDAVTIDGLVAVGCYASEDGGAVKVNTSVGQIDVKNSLFISNRANDEGAALYVKALNTGDVKVWHCTFDGNESGTPTNGQLWVGQLLPTNVLSHCIIANGDSTYAVKNGTAYIDSIRYVSSWNNGEDHIFGAVGATYTDTIHINPSYNCFSFASPCTCYAAKAKECRDLVDGSYMGWLEYIPPVLTPPTINAALHQSDYFQDLYAISDTVCCHSNHWDIIVPELTYASDWMIYPFGAKSKLADGINVKATLANSGGGWSETFFIPANYFTNIYWKNEFSFEQLFSMAVDTVAVQAVFSTCAAGSTLQYQFIMEGW
jgi:hypothetical protein